MWRPGSPEYPINEAVLSPHHRAPQWHVERCVICGREHWHGAGGNDFDPIWFLGDRAAHCAVDGPRERTGRREAAENADRPDRVPPQLQSLAEVAGALDHIADAIRECE